MRNGRYTFDSFASLTPRSEPAPARTSSGISSEKYLKLVNNKESEDPMPKKILAIFTGLAPALLMWAGSALTQAVSFGDLWFRQLIPACR